MLMGYVDIKVLSVKASELIEAILIAKYNDLERITLKGNCIIFFCSVIRKKQGLVILDAMVAS